MNMDFNKGDIIYDEHKKVILIYDSYERLASGLMISTRECIVHFIVLMNKEGKLEFSNQYSVYDTYCKRRFKMATQSQKDKIFDKLREIGKTFIISSCRISNIIERKFCFKTFDEVLVRKLGGCWHIGFYESYIYGPTPFKCMTEQWEECIPFNSETENLLLTKEEAPEKYKKIWEEMKLYYLGL